mmetsp:Transcript_22366/g.22055  ORF Transcript_22366/g.22055 Transcript_22366/m.22055 type:complete len:97 (+) Transcript_22366:3-293(+)
MRLVIASNQNDILPKFFETGTYSYHDEVVPSLSPSMDIAISSNFERFLYYLFKGDYIVARAPSACNSIRPSLALVKHHLSPCNSPGEARRTWQYEQ